MYLLSKPTIYIADFFAQTPLAFKGDTLELESARYCKVKHHAAPPELTTATMPCSASLRNGVLWLPSLARILPLNGGMFV